MNLRLSPTAPICCAVSTNRAESPGVGDGLLGKIVGCGVPPGYH
jgi:hypothetical protein